MGGDPGRRRALKRFLWFAKHSAALDHVEQVCVRLFSVEPATHSSSSTGHSMNLAA